MASLNVPSWATIRRVPDSCVVKPLPPGRHALPQGRLPPSSWTFPSYAAAVLTPATGVPPSSAGRQPVFPAVVPPGAYVHSAVACFRAAVAGEATHEATPKAAPAT